MLSLDSVHRRVFLVEPNVAIRSAVSDLLAGDGLEVETCDSLEQVLALAEHDRHDLALIAWQSMNGLLSDEHRPHLALVARRVQLVLTVPRRWARMLSQSDLGVAALIPKPFDADELLSCVRQLVSATGARS